METCNYLLYLALILMCTKFLGLLTRRARMPQVVGALLAGLLLGPAVFKIIPQTEFLTQTAEVGVVILMFCAGMETDVKELKKCGKAATIIAVIGVLVPLAGGFATAWFFNRPGMIESNVSTSIVLQNVFIGVILTATSVSITVETLKELGGMGKKIITLFNKQDAPGACVLRDFKSDYTLKVSAKTGEGLADLNDLLEKLLAEEQIYVERLFPYQEAGKIQLIREYGQLISEEYTEEGIAVKARVPKEIYARVV